MNGLCVPGVKYLARPTAATVLATLACIADATSVEIVVIDLANPRGIAIGPAGRIFVVKRVPAACQCQ